MLTIRSHQIEALGRDLEVRFEQRLAQLLMQLYEDAARQGAAGVRQAVHAAVARARAYGLRTEAELATYANAAWLLGEEFDTRFPAAPLVLSRRGLAPADKVEWLAAWTTALFEELQAG
ncbi:MAG: hypothetical protein HY744_23415 [Deltaproteobacteria bacterium]|nr:hypothetical protein [Deltaproteobacteria bacterium]